MILAYLWKRAADLVLAIKSDWEPFCFQRKVKSLEFATEVCLDEFNTLDKDKVITTYQLEVVEGEPPSVEKVPEVFKSRHLPMDHFKKNPYPCPQI